MLPVRSALGTLQDQIVTEWTALADSLENGDSTILSYNLQWDQATGDWVDVLGFSPTSMDLGTTQTVGIQGGKIYNYKVRA
jgi:hypothetical protein